MCSNPARFGAWALHRLTTMDEIDTCMTQADREAIDAHYRAISSIYARCNIIGSAMCSWTVDSVTTDGRRVRHRFSLKGSYEVTTKPREQKP
jgi:hypothetical protein